MKIIILALAIMLVIQNNAQSSDNNRWKAELLVGSFDAMEREKRLNAAMGLQEEIKALKNYLPSLTPEQKKWLSDERAALENLKGDAFFEKASNFSNSSEFQLENFHAALDQILNSTNCITQQTYVNIELYCWAQVNLGLTDSSRFNDAINILNNRQKVVFSETIRKQFNLSDGENPWFTYHLLGRSIQEQIVLPIIFSKSK